MIILVDVGNTCATFGLGRGEKVTRGWDLPTALILRERRFAAQLRRALQRRVGSAAVEAVIICSVVPPVEKPLARMMKKFFPAAFIGFLGKEVPVPVKNAYRFPGQVGKDRLANAAAACFGYSVPALVVDCGTAITIDVVSGRGEYLGGVIAPGLAMALSALHEKTALLPAVPLKKPAGLLGRDTANSMLSGVVHGTAMLIDGLIGRFKREYKGPFTVIATGGNAAYIKRGCRTIDVFDPELTLKGIAIAYKMMRK